MTIGCLDSRNSAGPPLRQPKGNTVSVNTCTAKCRPFVTSLQCVGTPRKVAMNPQNVTPGVPAWRSTSAHCVAAAAAPASAPGLRAPSRPPASPAAPHAPPPAPPAARSCPPARPASAPAAAPTARPDTKTRSVCTACFAVNRCCKEGILSPSQTSMGSAATGFHVTGSAIHARRCQHASQREGT